MMAEQTSTEPTATGHLRAGPRITLDELAVQLAAAAVWLRQLAVAAETPDVPVDLGGNLCDRLDGMAGSLAEFSGHVAKVDRVIAERVPLAPSFNGGDQWGARALEAPSGPSRKRPPIVLTMWQILSLARLPEDTAVFAELPSRPDRQRTIPPWMTDGIPYLDGLDGVPGLESWESPRADARRAAERAAAIQGQALQEVCTSCGAAPGQHCRTKTGRVADTFHRPRINAATTTVEQAVKEAPG